MEDNDDKKGKDNLRDIARKRKDSIMNKIKSKIIMGAVLATLKLIPIIILGVLVFGIFSTITDWLLKLIQVQGTPKAIYSSLEVENDDLSKLVEIKGNENDGYYLDFVDGADEKIKKAVEKANKSPDSKGDLTEEMLKKFIKTEVVTQYPDLGGTVKDGTNQFQGTIKVRRITPNKEYGEVKVASSGETTKSEVTDVSNGNDTKVNNGENSDKQITVGIMAAYSTDSPGGRTPQTAKKQLKEEELTIKVANYIEQILSIYDNIKVVQIGSTVENNNVSNEGRLQAARDANVDALIGIEFNSTGDGTKYEDSNGIAIAYNKDGKSDNSQKLGNILIETVSKTMGLGKIVIDQNDSSNTLGSKDDIFPSVMVRGGYLTSEKDYITINSDYGLQNYAKGVVNGILQYFDIKNKGYGSIVTGESSISSTIESNVCDLKYVPLDIFEKHVSENPKQALKEFSLDSNSKIVTATWSYNNGTLEVKKNSSALDYKSVIGKYTMPMEYLIDWYIYTGGQSKFVMDLAQLSIDSQYIMMLEDNITTVKKVTVTSKYIEEKQKDDNGDYSISLNSQKWEEVENTEEITEKVSSKMELTYIDTWFMKFTNKLLIDQESNKIQKANGTVSENQTSSETNSLDEEEWTESEKVKDKETGKETEKIKYKKRETTTKVTIDTTNISNSYKTVESEGGSVSEEKFMKIFEIFEKDERTKELLQDGYLCEALEKSDKTSNMIDLTKYLLSKALHTDKYGEIDPEELFNLFKPAAFKSVGSKNGSSSGNGVSIQGCTLTKEEFISRAGSYMDRADYQTYLVEHADEFYDICTSNDINPCIAFAHACLETGYGSSDGCQYENNYFGMGHGNTQSSGKLYSSAAESIQDYCDWINNKIDSPSSRVQEFALEDSRFADSTSIYAIFDSYAFLGYTHIADEPDFDNPNSDYYVANGSNSGTGGRYYLPIMYGDKYREECGHPNGSDPTTTKEQADYSVYATNQRISIAENIFGTDCLIKTGGSGSSILDAAETIHSYMEENSYSYCILGGEDNTHSGECGLDSTFEESKTNHQLTCCATYVSWALQEAGAIDNSEHTNSSSALASLLESKGWKRIDDYNDLEAGDIVFMNFDSPNTIQHTQIYAGNNEWYNAGTDEAIKNSSPRSQGGYASEHFLFAYRISE